MTTLVILGVILIIGGLATLFLSHLKWLNKTIMFVDEKLMKYRVSIGIIALIVAGFCLFMAYIAHAQMQIKF